MSLLWLDAYATDWLSFLARWLHVVAAIVWIGTSFYFIALDSHLLPPQRAHDRDEGVGGEAWEIHGGGFYIVQKYRVAPPTIPDPLYWFKWEAYTTWLSGFALFVVLYYANARAYLIDPGVADLSPGVAIAISVGLLAVAWVVYDLLCRALEEAELVLAAALAGLVVLASWGVGELFSPRAAYVQVGAMLGTIMVANVFFVIIPAHRKLIAAKQLGREPDPEPGLRAKQRSVHNNYLTLPVVFAMISNHFPTAYAHAHAWLILVVMMGLAAWTRHFFNLRHQGRTVWWIPATAALGVAAVAFAIRPESAAKPSGPTATQASFVQASSIVQRRCVPCHSQDPSNPSFSEPPKGIAFDTAEEIRTQADAIEQQAVLSRAMPLGNATGMTDEERDLLGAWIRAGANVR